MMLPVMKDSQDIHDENDDNGDVDAIIIEV
jgi:hypothetical protein